MNDDFEPEDLSDLDDFFPSLGKPAVKAAKAPAKTSPATPPRKLNAPPSHDLNWTEIRPVAKSRDEAIVCLVHRITCIKCANWGGKVIGIFLKRIHLHHSPVTELIRLNDLSDLPPLPREVQTEFHTQPICWSCMSRLGFKP